MTDLQIRHPEPSRCKCHKCGGNVMHWLGDVPVVGMTLCPICGNKRCPKASDHDLECTGSNEPGQPGSVYGPPLGHPRADLEGDAP